MSEYFYTLYEPIVDDGDLQTLESNVYIPETDDPITSNEIRIAANTMKKGGYDYPLTVLQLLMSSTLSLLLLLLNMILFNGFPSKLWISLLSIIPKAGNLRLPTNYQGIQMQPLIANLFDIILANRLIRWVKVNYEQIAFQKGKSTLDQIFILRMLTALIKSKNIVLYIGFFD